MLFSKLIPISSNLFTLHPLFALGALSLVSQPSLLPQQVQAQVNAFTSSESITLRQSMSLEEAVIFASHNSPKLLIAEAAEAEKRAGIAGARSTLEPQLSANSFATLGSYTSIYGSSPGVTSPYWLNIPNNGFADQNLSLMIPLLTGGRLGATVSAARSDATSAVGAIKEAQAELRLAVTGAYLTILVKQQLASSQSSRLSATQELERTLKAQFAAGTALEASVDRARAETARAKRALTSALNEVAKSRLDLDAALGISFESELSLADTLTDARASVVSAFPMPLAAALKTAKTERGKLISARADFAGQSARVKVARGQSSPQLYAQAMADLGSRAMGGGPSSGGSLGLTLGVPLWDGGKIRADVAAAKARETQAKAAVAEASLEVENEVRHAYLDIQTADENLKSAEAGLTDSRANAQVVAMRFGVGKALLVERLDALQAVTQAEADVAQARFDRAIAIAQLQRAMGVTR